MKVLIADNSIMVCKRLTAMLTILEGVEIVGQVHTVSEAIGAIDNLKPEVVILDIRMPGGNGYNVLQYIRKSASTTVVIMLTNYAHVQYRSKYLSAGADYFFDKSLEFENVADILAELEKRQQKVINNERKFTIEVAVSNP